ncbi:MAG: SGNH/GDSL hydrolase family protein [Bacilli bacterium]|nr:SGNH/GDSL hydrolase family protein [Bacilli bacterium]
MSKTIDIKKVDSNFINEEAKEDILYIDPKNSDLVKIYGLNWFNEDKRYHRLSKSLDEVLPELEGSVDVLAGNSTGGMIAFYSNTNVLKIKVKLSFKFHMGHMPYTGQAGFDLYIGKTYQDMKFYRTSNFDFSKMEYEFTYFNHDKLFDENKLFVLNFPLYATVEEVLVGINPISNITPCIDLFNNNDKIVFYGTSITQGGCASRPGMSYTQILSRMLGIECLNYGFSGNGKGHIEIAEALSSIKDVKMFVLDYEANATFDRLKATLDNFVKCLRKSYPNVPIVIISKIPMYLEFHDDAYKANEKKVRSYQKNYVKNANDANLYYIDGAKVLGKTNVSEKTVDGCHPTDYGFISMAEYLYPIIKKILG